MRLYSNEGRPLGQHPHSPSGRAHWNPDYTHSPPACAHWHPDYTHSPPACAHWHPDYTHLPPVRAHWHPDYIHWRAGAAPLARGAARLASRALPAINTRDSQAHEVSIQLGEPPAGEAAE